jgi:hypothetical protein
MGVACVSPMAESILAQHQNIDHALLAIEELLDQKWDARRLESSVAGFAMILQAHFEQEERSYLFIGFVEDYPRFAHQIDGLKMEHVEMRAEVGSILDGLNRLSRDLVAVRIRALMARLGLHESHEIDLLQRAHTDDLAPGD